MSSSLCRPYWCIGIAFFLSFFHDLVQFLICKALVYFETSHRIYVLARTEKNKSFYMNKDLQNSKALQMYKKPALCRAPEQGVRDVTVMSLMFGVPSTSGTNIFDKPEVEFSTSNGISQRPLISVYLKLLSACIRSPMQTEDQGFQEAYYSFEGVK